MRVMLLDGSIVRCSPTEQPDLFRHVVGGYGLFGVVLDAELAITDNVVYTTGRQVIDYQEFPDVFARELASDPKLGLFYAHLSTSPASLLGEMILYTYRETDAPGAEIPPLAEVSSEKLRRFVLNFSKRGSIPMRLKWLAEKYIEPRMESCLVSRAQAQRSGEACLVTRNEPMHDSVRYLQNNLKRETDILQEYFVPRDRFIPFVDGLRAIIRDHDTTLLNASVRIVHREDVALTYAPEDMFAIVLYINQPVSDEGNRRMRDVTRAIIDLAINHGGTYFLPYQLHATDRQLHAAYPQLDAFRAARRRYDPEGVLSSTFAERYRLLPSAAGEAQ
jgi:FAD/FMN-containing dehydrogenase